MPAEGAAVYAPQYNAPYYQVCELVLLRRMNVGRA